MLQARIKYTLYGLLLATLLAVPFIGVYPIFAMKLLCYAMFASAFNLLLGYTGLAAFGHAAFFGGAGYVAGHAMKVWGFSPEIGLLTGAAFGALTGWLMGVLSIRRRAIYFTMITLALAQMVFFFFLQAPFTGGEDGLQGVPRGALFGMISLRDDINMYYVTLAIAGATFLFIMRVVHSPFGAVLRAIKDNEERAISLGYDADRYKLLVFVLSAALTGLAGALKTLALGFATLTDVHWHMSGNALLMTLVGGVGTLSGPLVGAIVLVGLESRLGSISRYLADLTGLEWFAVLGESVTIVTGLIFVVCVLLFRRGIVGEAIALLQRLERRDKATRRLSEAVDQQATIDGNERLERKQPST